MSLFKHYKSITLLLVGLIAGFYLNLFYARYYSRTPMLGSVHPIREKNTNYKFISPLLSYDLPPNTQLAEFKELNEKIKILIAEKLAEGKVDRLGVYFKDFTSGQWTGINEEGLFQPASLLKIPIMVAYFKLTETNKSLLDRVVSIVPTKATSFTRAPSRLYKVGWQYKIGELIRGMIVESDNDAADTLIANIDPDFLSGVFGDLGISPPNSNDESQATSPKTFGLFFRVLYNSTYLERDFSEKALAIMDQVDYKDGIDTSNLKNISVADKFGERVILKGEGSHVIDLSDCGIVYYPSKPYLLCIMTEGKNEDNLKQVIQDISNLTLDEVRGGVTKS